ncbi:30S ribosomal protein S6e [Candidatus Geothermarchaeota archaeon ex4572_27]|nr:MAG: 30S ribosomal protein S6e [Candidatus Geothermarchaeota archaeon ex4572_27]
MAVTFKLNISDPKTGKAYTREITEPQSLALLGKKIGDVIDGSVLGLEWKKLKITGGSDKSGVPMRPDVEGPRKTYILTGIGIGLRKPRGLKPKKRGYRRRILVRGNTISRDIYQVNMVIIEE